MKRVPGPVVVKDTAFPERFDAAEAPAEWRAVTLSPGARPQAEARHAFLLDLQDSLRSLTDTTDILTEAATRLGRHLGAARIGYSEVQPDDETALVTNGYADGAPPVNGIYPILGFGAEFLARLRRGQTAVYADARAAADVQALDRQFGTRAHVTVPLVREGRFIGSLYVTHLHPHDWSEDEVALIEQVTARIWEASERARAEARLRESEERLRLVLESTGFGSWEYDARTEKMIRSARHDEIFGYAAPVPDWGYARFNAHIPEADRARVEAGFHAALRDGADWDVESRIIRVDGSEGWIRVKARPHLGPDGKIARLLGTVADITERRQSEEALRETSAKFETFAQTMPSMVWSSLPDGSMEWFNARVTEYSGMGEGNLKPVGWAPVHPEDAATAIRLWRQAMETGEPYTTEYRIRRHDGMYRWHITRAVPIRGAAGEIIRWIGTSADIHDQKTAEQAVAELNATLEQQVRERTAALMAAEERLRQSQKMEAVGQLTGGLAHDFNNLLTGISGSLEMLEKRLAQGRTDELERYARTAQGAAKRAAALTHRLLAFSRRQTLDPKPTDVNRLTAGIDELIRRTVGPAIEVRVAGAEGLWGVLVDPNQLENALLNLCINARDAMPGGGRLTIAAENVSLDGAAAEMLELEAGCYVALSVADDGCGMTEAVAARAFDPFFTTKPSGQGTGLGLSMVYGFARQSGGQAQIRSQPGQGTQVRLYLPRYDAQAEAAPEHDALVPGGPRGEAVLVVDDDATVRMLVKEALDERGYAILEAQDGASGLAVLQSGQRVDLLVTDVGLPGGMNGRQLADAARVLRPELKILFITGYAETAVIGQGRLGPGMHILTKPFALEAFLRRIDEIVSMAS